MFYGCKGLTSVISNIPGDKLFAIDRYVFYTIDKDNCTLFVPAGSKDVYASTSYWSEFKNIVEFDPTAIDNVADDAPAFEFTQNGILLTAAESKSVAVYTVSGALVTKIASYTGEEIVLDKGTYVVRVGGKAVKVQL